MVANPDILYKITLPQIVDTINMVADSNIKSGRRDEHTVFCRWIYFKIAKSIAFRSLNKIGMEVNRDHATVIHGLSGVDEILKDPRYEYYYNKTLQELGLKPKNVDILSIVEVKTEDINYNEIKNIVEAIKVLDKNGLNDLLEYRIKPFLRTYKPNTNDN